MSPNLFIGTSGWHYDHWRGNFYPQKLSRKDWLNYYSGHFNTVEINAAFYRLPLGSTYDNWHQVVPQEFCFAVKVSRLITHIKRLKNSEEPLLTFTSRAEHLGDNLGPLLYQLPPNFQRDDDRLETFLRLLDKKLRHVFEFRHQSWMDDTVYRLLNKYNAAFCIYDMPGFTSPLITTADLAYVRFHGHDDLYSSRYPDAELSNWAKKLAQAASNLKYLYVYFNNDASGFAVENALTLRKYLEGK
jgi:uncharacterized protein YecE (DUF72 family)